MARPDSLVTKRIIHFLLLTMCLSLALFSLGDTTARGDYASNATTLNAAVGAAGVVWDGTKVWILGGMTSMGGSSRKIQHFSPSANTAGTLSQLLPDPVSYAPAVYTGTHIYQFGGDKAGEASSKTTNNIVKFDPLSQVTPTVLAARLPARAAAMAAVWTGQYAYLLGGYNHNNQALNSIWRFDPSTETIATMTATLPSPRWASSAVWDGSKVVLFGGRQNYLYDETSEILTYDPSTGTIITKGSKMPYFASAAVWDGYNALIFGGANHANGYCESCAYEYDYIYKYTPSSDRLSRMTGYLPSPLQTVGAAFDGRSVWLAGGYYTQYGSNCGGYSCSWSYVPSNSVTKYSLAPAAPKNVLALPTALSPTTWTIQWAAPGANTYSAPITSFKIYKSDTLGSGGYGGTPYATVPGNRLTFIDTCGTAYSYVCYYSVSAETSQGEGPRSELAYAIATKPGGY